MKIQLTTIDDVLDKTPIEQECYEITVMIGDQKFRVSDRNGELSIRVDGDLSITPIAINTIAIKENLV